MSNFLKLISVLFLFLWIASCNNNNQSKEKQPNIIYILADDLGYGDIAAFNKESGIKTPYLDQMASEGMKFTDAHTPSSVCTPTRYALLTGRYAWRSRLKKGVLGGKSKALIPSSRTTIASLLKKQNYQTAFIGKWHLGWDWALFKKDSIDFSRPVTNNPNDLGFDYAYGHCGSLDMAPYVYVENGMATAIPTEFTVDKGRQSWWRKGLTSPDFVHKDVTPNFIRRAVSYVAEKAKDKKPFFLYVPLPSPHTPILPTKEFQGKSGLDNPYADFVMMVDAYIGKLLEQVKSSGIENNTMIVFTSDNGCSPEANFKQLISKGHNPSGIYRGHKADIFEGGHRVPFIVKWPQVIEQGTTNEQIICITDFVSTVASITNYKLKDNEAEDSFNMMPLLTQDSTGDAFRKTVIHHSINGSFAIRKGNYKLIMCSDSGGWSFPRPNTGEAKVLPEIQLYDLSNDPGEKNNLQEDLPEIVEELKELLRQQILEGRSTAGLKQQNDTGTHWKQLWWMEE